MIKNSFQVCAKKLTSARSWCKGRAETWEDDSHGMAKGEHNHQAEHDVAELEYFKVTNKIHIQTYSHLESTYSRCHCQSKHSTEWLDRRSFGSYVRGSDVWQSGQSEEIADCGKKKCRKWWISVALLQKLGGAQKRPNTDQEQYGRNSHPLF